MILTFQRIFNGYILLIFIATGLILILISSPSYKKEGFKLESTIANVAGYVYTIGSVVLYITIKILK